MTNSRESSQRIGLTRRRLLQSGVAAAGGAVLYQAGVATPAFAGSDSPVAPQTQPRLHAVPGDRHIGTQAYFPATAFRHNSPGTGRVIDVTKVEEALGAPSGTNAVPDDPSRDAADAFIYILGHIREQLGEVTPPAPFLVTAASYIIYVPNGTYYVGRSIRYPGQPMDRRWALMRIVGQSRENTVLRVPDNADFAGQVLSFKHPRNTQTTVPISTSCATSRSTPGPEIRVREG